MHLLLTCHSPEYLYVQKYIEIIANSSYSSCQEFISDLSVLFNYQHGNPLEEQHNLNGLTQFFQSIQETELKIILTQLIPFIARLALQEKQIWPEHGPLYLEQDKIQQVDLTKHEVSVILANMFLMSTPKYKQRKTQLVNPCEQISMDFWIAFGTQPETQAKLKCIFSYFQRVYSKQHDEQWKNLKVSFQRNKFEKKILDNIKDVILGEIEVLPNGSIEEAAASATGETIQVDFANKSIGGGVLFDGNVQEEILFSVCPEKLVSILLCDIMKDDESILICGAERFCIFSGYGWTFKFEEDYHDKTPINKEANRIRSNTACIDAIFFQESQYLEQFSEKNVTRELIKAIAGFKGPSDVEETSKSTVITGNWGCGIFNGDVHVKLLIQWIACSVYERKMVYCGFGNEKIQEKQIQIINSIKGKRAQDVLEMIYQFPVRGTKCPSLLSFISQELEK